MISPRGRKFLSFVVIAAGIIVILSIAINWWFQRNAIYLIKTIVEKESHGQYKIDIGRLKIHYFHPPRVEIFDTQLHVYDSTGKNLMYEIGVSHLALQGKSLRNLVFGKKLLVDYIMVEAPGINIHTQQIATDNKRSGSLSHQIGNITLFLQQLARTMEVKSLKITNGALGLHDLKPYNKSVRLNNLNFLVNNFHSDSSSERSDTQFLFSDNIELEAGRQNIEFPDNRHTLSFSSLEISTQSRNIDIYDASLTGRSTDTTLGSYKVDFRRLHLINTDFNTLYQYDRIKVDSIYCHEPRVDLFIDASSKKDSVATDSTTEVMIKQLVGDMDIKYVGFLNSTIAVTAKNRSGITHYSTKGANLEFFGVKINPNEYQSSLVDRVNLSIRNYRASSADSLYDIFLDSVTMTEKNLYLKNFRLMPSDRNTSHTRRTIVVPTLELRNISFYNLVFFKKLTATELILTNPSITDYYTSRQVSRNNSQQSFGQILMAISRHAQVNQLIIVNGNLLSQSVSSQDRKVEITGMYTAVDTKLLTSDTSFENLQTSLSNVAFQRALLTFPRSQFELTDGIFIGANRILTAKTVRGSTNDNNFILSADNVRIHGYVLQKTLEKAHIDSVQWTNATIQFHQRTVERKKETGPKPLDITVRYLNLLNTKLDMDLQDGLFVKTDLQTLSFQNFNISPERKFVLSNLVLDGKFLQLRQHGMEINAGDFSVHENQRSYINNLDFDIEHRTQKIKGRIPRMEMQFQLHDLLDKGNILVSRLDMRKPEISIHINDGEKTPEKARKSRRIVDINELNIEQAKIDFSSELMEQKTAFSTPDASIFLKGLSSGTLSKQSFSLKEFDVKLTGYNINNHDSILLYSEKGKILIAGSNVAKGSKEDPKLFTAHIAVAEVNDANTEFIRKSSSKPVKFENISAGVRDLDIDTLENHHIGQQLKANPYLFIRNINIIQKDEKNDMAIYGIQYSNGGHVLSLDSFSYKPAVDRETFNRGIPHEKDYVQAKTGRIRLSGIDIEKLIADSSFSASKIEVNHPWLSIYKDKHNPFDSSKYKPLPTNLLKKIKFGVEVDSLKLNEAAIEYLEWNDRTHKEGGFDFSHVNVLIRNIRNRNAGQTDSLELLANARWLDSINVKVDFAESYLDSLATFKMAAAMGPFDAKKLNRFLPAIVSAEIMSGYMDTMRMNAIGRENVALGYMQLLYHDAKIRFLDKGNPVKKTFKTRLVTFFANTIIRKKNENRVGKIYAERIQYRGIFNYWLRIVLGGVVTNTGVKSNARQVKKYQKELKKLNLPPIPDVNF